MQTRKQRKTETFSGKATDPFDKLHTEASTIF